MPLSPPPPPPPPVPGWSWPFLKMQDLMSIPRGSEFDAVPAFTMGSTLIAHFAAVLSSRRHRDERRYSPVRKGTMVVICTSSLLMTYTRGRFGSARLSWVELG